VNHDIPQTSVRNLSTLLQKVTVLVYDPDPPIAGIVRQVLTRLGFGKILMAHSSEEALDLFLENHVDFIITDHDIAPVRDGLTFISFIRTSPHSVQTSVPIIMLSGHTEEKDILRARDAGITEFAAKPFTAKSLTDRIVRVIENPRSFIITKRYIGPDRRHKDISSPALRRKEDMPQQTAPAAAEPETPYFSMPRISESPPSNNAPVYSSSGEIIMSKTAARHRGNIFKRLLGK
jgi:two-component system, chemotaxis family, chemotaxis protein CheY